jgi:hypothetical protein
LTFRNRTKDYLVFKESNKKISISESDPKDLTLGHIVSHNKKAGEIVIKTDKSTGHRRLSNHAVILSGKKRVDTFRDLEQNPKSSGPCFPGGGDSADLCFRVEIAGNPASAIV